MRNGMASDFSWTRSAHQYLDAYQKLSGHSLNFISHF